MAFSLIETGFVTVTLSEALGSSSRLEVAAAAAEGLFGIFEG